MMPTGESEPTLPDDYDALKYIESNGVQYIATDVVIRKTDKIKCTGAFTNGSAYEGALFCGGVANYHGLGLGSFSRKSPYTSRPAGFMYGYKQYDSNSSILIPLRQFYTSELDGTTGVGIIDGTTVQGDPTYAGRDLIETPYYLCAYQSQPNVALKINNSVRIQYAEVTGRGIFLPCKRKLDNIVGVYNAKTNTFLTNSGSGTFGYETLDGTYVAPTNS